METVVFSALVWKVIDFARHLVNFAANKSAVVTQALAWIAGILAVVVGAHAGATDAIVLPGVDQTLGQLDGWSQVVVGFLIASTASAAVDVKQAIDGTDSNVKPPLLGGAAVIPRNPCPAESQQSFDQAVRDGPSRERPGQRTRNAESPNLHLVH